MPVKTGHVTSHDFYPGFCVIFVTQNMDPAAGAEEAYVTVNSE